MPTGQTVTKLRHIGNRILVRLRIVDGYLSFANSKCNVNTLLWGNTVNVKNKMRSIFDGIVIYSTY